MTTDLQLAVMKTRMLPIKKVMAKLPRMVRDLSQKLGKQVRLETHGEETELDKSVADEIGDPLVHLVRNAIDHGIEMPTERHAARKPSEGVLRIAASQEGNSIVIRIQDDGKGIALSKIKAKALSKGLISEAELATMEPREVVNLVFLPGFSTAEKVTDVSGRGVGMDVVRTNIRKMNGTVEIESEEGKGSLITIKLPLTIAIIQALMVEVERATFAIPLSSVIEAVRISKDEIKTINGREVLHLRDRVLPLLRLAKEFEIPTDRERDRFYVVVAALGRPADRCGRRRIALAGRSRHQVHLGISGQHQGHFRRHDYRRRKGRAHPGYFRASGKRPSLACLRHGGLGNRVRVVKEFADVYAD